MALKCKRPHIRLDQKIWDDPVLVDLSPSAFKVWVFGISWSSDHGGYVPDGVLTSHALARIGASAEVLEELTASNLLAKQDDGSYKIVKYAEWQVTFEEGKEAHEARVAGGMIGSTRRYGMKSQEDLPPIEDGFGWRAAFEAAFEVWPQTDEYHEGKAGALEAFRANITTQADYDLFSAALMARMRKYKAEKASASEKRKYLGAFRTFCRDKWRDWIPPSHSKTNVQKQEVQEEQQPVPKHTSSWIKGEVWDEIEAEIKAQEARKA